MDGRLSEETVVGMSEGMWSNQRCQSSEALAEWRSSEQVENGIASTSPSYSEDSDDDVGSKPSELYGKFTWKVEKFSKTTKKDLRSNVFEIGGYKWYILIYPQGCDVCNHLSLFLCVADHDKLLPGWSHFAQFTIAVVNKEPKKSKYSDTLHRFWKKEHDWGWKKFLELSKVSDGFVDADTLVIRAQVQVIREKADRPFRCLDYRYRRELIRVYLTNVEQLCWRFAEERRGKLKKLLEDKAQWSSFRTFWLGIDQISRRHMSKEKMDLILKLIVKQFFIEKEVTSTLVMDSLYCGLNVLLGLNKSKKVKGNLLDGVDLLSPIVQVEKDMFVLKDDALLLLERAALEPLHLKDEKGPQNRTKDGNAGEDFNKESTVRDELRLTLLGRRTLEIFVFAHIFSNKIEVAYQEAVALEMQEELIREEQEASLAKSVQKSKHALSEKEKKSRKKQLKGKQKGNDRKRKDKAKDEKSTGMLLDKQLYHLYENADGKTRVELETRLDKDDTLEDASDITDPVDGAADMQQHDSDRDASPVDCVADTLDTHSRAESSSKEVGESISTVSNETYRRSPLVMEDDTLEDASDTSDSVDGAAGMRHHDSDRDASPVDCLLDTLDTHSHAETSSKEVGESIATISNWTHRRSPSVMDDSSSTTCMDSAPSVARNESHPENSFSNTKGQNPPTSENLHSSVKGNGSSATSEADSQPSGIIGGRHHTDVSPGVEVTDSEKPVSRSSSALSINQAPGAYQHKVHKEDKIVFLKKKPSDGDQVAMKISMEKAPVMPYFPRSPSRSNANVPQMKSDTRDNPALHHFLGTKTPPSSTQQTEMTTLSSPHQTEKAAPHSHQHTEASASSSSQQTAIALSSRIQQTEKTPLSTNMSQSQTVLRPDSIDNSSLKPPDSVPLAISRPSSAPPIPGPKPVMAPAISAAQAASTAPFLSHSLSEAGRAGPDPPGSYVSQSYRNSIIGTSSAGPYGFGHLQQVSLTANPSWHISQQTTMVSAPMFLPCGSDGVDSSSINSGASLGLSSRDIVHSGRQWMGSPQRRFSRSMTLDSPSNLNDLPSVDSFRPANPGAHMPAVTSDVHVSVSSQHTQNALAEEFPHLHIITDLFDDEQQGSVNASETHAFRGMNSLPNLLNQQLKLPGDVGMPGDLASLANSCRFEQHYYHDGFRPGYGSGGQFDSLQEFIPQANLMPYSNGHIDRLVPHQWPVGGPDFSLDASSWSNGYPYNVNGYSHPGGALNRYTMFRPSNGH